MSIRAMTIVWDYAINLSGGPLVVLLKMADYAHDDGTGVYPKQETLAAKSRMTDRHLRRVLAALEKAGYIERDGKRAGVVQWRLDLDPDMMSARTPMSDEPGHGGPTEPSIEPSGSETISDPSSASTENEQHEAASSFAGAEKYAEPTTLGAKAAPWLALELGRLMRENDEKVRLPAGLRDAVTAWMLPEMRAMGRQPEHARQLLVTAGWKASAKPWLDAMRLLIDSDERPAQEVVKVLRWCQVDSFWKTNVLSATKFRDQYDKLRARWTEEGDSGRRAGGPTPAGPSAAQMDRMAGRAA